MFFVATLLYTKDNERVFILYLPCVLYVVIGVTVGHIVPLLLNVHPLPAFAPTTNAVFWISTAIYVMHRFCARDADLARKLDTDAPAAAAEAGVKTPTKRLPPRDEHRAMSLQTSPRVMPLPSLADAAPASPRANNHLPPLEHTLVREAKLKGKSQPDLSPVTLPAIAPEKHDNNSSSRVLSHEDMLAVSAGAAPPVPEPEPTQLDRIVLGVHLRKWLVLSLLCLLLGGYYLVQCGFIILFSLTTTAWLQVVVGIAFTTINFITRTVGLKAVCSLDYLHTRLDVRIALSFYFEYVSELFVLLSFPSALHVYVLVCLIAFELFLFTVSLYRSFHTSRRMFARKVALTRSMALTPTTRGHIEQRNRVAMGLRKAFLQIMGELGASATFIILVAFWTYGYNRAEFPFKALRADGDQFAQAIVLPLITAGIHLLVWVGFALYVRRKWHMDAILDGGRVVHEPRTAGAVATAAFVTVSLMSTFLVRPNGLMSAFIDY